MKIRELLRKQLTQPHWLAKNELTGQPYTNVIRASVDDLTTDIVHAFDQYLQHYGYEGLRKLIRDEK